MSNDQTVSESWAAVAAIAGTQHAAFSREQAAEVGLDARRLRAATARGLLRRPLSDVYVFAYSPQTIRQRCSIASLAGGVISHESSAMLHGLDGFDEDSATELHVSFPRNHKRALPSYRVHTWRRTRSSDITWVDGIRCTSVARTLVQLGLHQPREVVEVALDSALRKGASPKWIEATFQRLCRPGPTGRQVLGDIMADPGRSKVLTDSLFETILERALKDPELPRPQRQFEVAVASGVRRFDLAFPDAKLGIEAHSRRVHFGSASEERDNLRDIELAAAGWEVLYITWGMAHQPELFLRLLKQTYQRRRELHDGAASG